MSYDEELDRAIAISIQEQLDKISPEEANIRSAELLSIQDDPDDALAIAIANSLEEQEIANDNIFIEDELLALSLQEINGIDMQAGGGPAPKEFDEEFELIFEMEDFLNVSNHNYDYHYDQRPSASIMSAIALTNKDDMNKTKEKKNKNNKKVKFHL